ncbi:MULTISPECIES: hypothetical protein [Bacillus]|uniref:DUF5659 domain-containing protein n=1 Tax=Bacillus wiedmannii TaxID=1890302 RepID=A0A2A7BR14_9BACI|nr:MULTISPECIES: hypothetical protein [Bacillus]EJV49976.1 hypothetical protein IEA_01345 [Bacillus toyonensis]EOP38960.1 hypothetical protein IKI_03481 [Bacillus toyonensis]MBE7135929.1 hypothetical protein [Bacillus toyonensis]MBE7164979.1 hypothetical protein [Bacillus toyonensis]PDY40628.1 hypothetical protein COO17_15995 [Bacillus wiedmannii]
MKYKDIYAKWLATELIKRGHELEKVVPNPERSKFYIFVFVNTEALIEDLVEITKAKHSLQKLVI